MTIKPLYFHFFIFLNSKYRFFLNLIIFVLIYLYFYIEHITHCMMEDHGSHSTIFKNELDRYLQNAQTIESQSKIIEEQKQIIETKDVMIEEQNLAINQFQLEAAEDAKDRTETNTIIRNLESDLRRLDRDIHKGGTTTNPRGYKQTILDLSAQLKDSQAQLNLAENLLDKIMKDNNSK